MSARKPIQFTTTSTGCFEVTSHKPNTRGYPQIRRNGRLGLVSRMIWEECFGPIPEGMYVCHHCDNPKCINPEHFFLGTPADNNHDRDMKGRQARGETQGHAKLTEEAVRQIRRRYHPNGGCNSGYALAREFGVDPATIRDIIAGKEWKHILSNGRGLTVRKRDINSMIPAVEPRGPYPTRPQGGRSGCYPSNPP